MKRIIHLPVILLLLSGCSGLTGEEKARLSFNAGAIEAAAIKEISLDLRKDEVISFWSDMDLEYENDLGLAYVIELSRDSVFLGEINMDALKTNPTMMETSTTFGSKTSRSFTGKMGTYTATLDGNYLIRAVLHSSGNPTMTLSKADLVIRMKK